MKYNNITITDAGEQYILQCLEEGKPLRPVYIAIGDGALTDGTEKQRTALINEVYRCVVEEAVIGDGSFTYSGSFGTAEITADITHRETGLLTEDGLLIAYGNAGEDCYDYIPAAGSNTELRKTLKVKLHVQAGLEVKYTFPDTSNFVTYTALKAQINDMVDEIVIPIAEKAKEDAIKQAEEAAKKAADEQVIVSTEETLHGFDKENMTGTAASATKTWQALDILDDTNPGRGKTVNRITLHGTGGAGTSLWLAAYAYNPGDGTQWLLGVSSATGVAGADQTTWTFSSGIHMGAKYSLELYLVDSPANAGASEATPAASGIASAFEPNGICSLLNGGSWDYGYTPYLSMSSDGYLAQTTEQITQGMDDHINDQVRHITAAERTAWNAKADASALTAHAAKSATASELGHVKLGESTVANSSYAGKVCIDENGRMSVRVASTSVPGVVKLASDTKISAGANVQLNSNNQMLVPVSTTNAYGAVKIGTSTQVDNDAGMVGLCSNGALAVRKASTNSTSGVGCVKLATSLDDTGAVSVPIAAQVKDMFILVNAYKRWSDTALDASTITQDMLDSIINGREAFQRCGLSDTNLLPMEEGGDGATDTRIRFHSLMNAICIFFQNASFNQPVSFDCAATARKAFGGCTAFNSAVYAPAVADAQFMFHACTSLNKEVASDRWIMEAGDVIVLESAQFCMYTFAGCTSLNKRIYLPSATSCDSMLLNCTAFNSQIILPLASNVRFMLQGCTSYNQPLYLPSAYDCYYMLANCSSFNSPVILPRASACNGMLEGCTAMSVANIVKTMESLPTWTDGQVHILGLPTTCADGTTESVLTDEQKAIATNKGWILQYT